LPSHSIKVRCPKCQGGIDVRAPILEPDPNAISPAAGHGAAVIRKFAFSAANCGLPGSNRRTVIKRPITAKMSPCHQLTSPNCWQPRFVRLYQPPKDQGVSPSWERRKALVCTNPEHRNRIANSLVAMDFEVFVAENTAEALGRMREDPIAVLVLESDFDPVEQGFAFVTREIKLMRPAERRRLFLTFLTPTARTMDLHAAFLNNANLVVNDADVERFPEALEASMRHFNELYRDFNKVLEMPAI
jgi:hypothetical protein